LFEEDDEVDNQGERGFHRWSPFCMYIERVA